MDPEVNYKVKCFNPQSKVRSDFYKAATAVSMD